MVMSWLAMRARAKLDAWWSYVPEPRAVSAFFAGVYFISFLVGLSTVLAPSTALLHIADPLAIVLISVALMVGAVTSSIASISDYWKLERIGLTFQLGGVAMYFFLSLVPYFMAYGKHPINPWLVLMAGGVLLVRYILIRTFTRRPGARRP